MIQSGYNDGQVDDRSKEPSKHQGRNLLQDLERDSLHKMIGNAEAFQKEENESAQGQVRECHECHDAFGLIGWLPSQRSVQERKKSENVATQQRDFKADLDCIVSINRSIEKDAICRT